MASGQSRLPTLRKPGCLMEIMNNPQLVKKTTIDKVLPKPKAANKVTTFKAGRKSLGKPKTNAKTVNVKTAVNVKTLSKPVSAMSRGVTTRTVGKVLAVATENAQPKTTIRAPPAPRLPRVALKRPITTSASTSTISSQPNAPPNKISKYDYKGRFNQLDEKHKALVLEHKTVNKNFESVSEEFNNFKEVANKKIEEAQVIERESVELKRTVNKLKEEFQYTKHKFTELTKEYETLELDKETLEKNNKRIEKEYKSVIKTNEFLSHENEELKNSLKSAHDLLEKFKKSLLEKDELRRILHNQVQDLKGNIRVFCRVRPLMEDEMDKLPCNFNFLNESTFELKREKASMSCMTGKMTEMKSEFNFDHVFPGPSKQMEIFEDLSQLIQSTLDGYNICVFAYGQTGSGKTFTMMGTDKDPGMIPLSIDLLFAKTEGLQQFGWTYEVHASVLEIYNENIKDLLNPNSKGPYNILYNEGKSAIVTNLKAEYAGSATKLKTIIAQANRNRAVAATNFNLHSSRSHMVIKIAVQGQNEESKLRFNGSLNLVDLAGSENAKNSERMDETKSINKSLTALGTVMLNLHNKKSHVPYRDSKLTYLLQSSLGGDSKTLMFVNISPLEENFNETLNSLRFASKVKEVKTQSKRYKTCY